MTDHCGEYHCAYCNDGEGTCLAHTEPDYEAIAQARDEAAWERGERTRWAGEPYRDF